MSSHKLLLTIFFLYIAGFVSAQSMGLALEGEEWTGVAEYPVKGRSGNPVKSKLEFGGYETIEIDRSWTKGTTGTTGITQGIPTDENYKKLLTADDIDKKQTLYFTLSDSAGNKSRAFCLSRLQAKDFNIGNSPVSAHNLLLDILGPGIESSNVFFSKIFVDRQPFGWELIMDNVAAVKNPKEYTGYLAKNDDEYYMIVPFTRVKSKNGKTGEMPFGSAGFIIRNKEGQSLAAVSMIDKGVIYLKNLEVNERLLMATACAALLLRPADM